MQQPTLICCSHGTDSPEGRAVISKLVSDAVELLDGVPHHETYVDVQTPQIDEVVDAVEGPAVIVPILLSPGFHTAVDIARAASARDDVVASGTLGPHLSLVDILGDRVREIGLRSDDHVVLAAAGSTRPESAQRVEEVREMLATQFDAPLTVGYAYGAEPKVADAVRAAREGGAGRVIIASYVLAPGHFADMIADSGADIVTDPVGTDPRVVGVIAERYRDGLDLLDPEI
ncbi:sirohydrochlorin chelatase [Microbacterium sp. G2-8]|uniref:sirohydrochlorin chelatase n=1 Tax=Microbacterium sp. G2-8 TaxID=2842454 RepID=UPI001C8A58AB|nr:sirohydrochlorin chelatase [Microbacterium sp. G2-8]